MGLFNQRKAADARADADPHGLRVLFRDRQAGLRKRLPGGGDRVVDEGVELLDLLPFEEKAGVETLHLSRDPAGIVRRVEAGDGADPRTSREERVPVLLRRQADGRDETDSRDDDPAAAPGIEKIQPGRHADLRRASRATRCR